MMIQPKIRGFICTTAHPIGCAKSVQEQIEYVKSHGTFDGPKNVLVIGASTGYGLASRIVAAFGANANTIGVAFEKGADEKRTASAGWYNTAAFEKAAREAHLYSRSINGDAFSNAVKEATIELIQQELKSIDLVIYSLASPRRKDPMTGEVYSSVLKPINQPFHGKTIDAFRGEVKDVTIEPANDAEIEATVKVMGGEDWQLWMKALKEANVLAKGIKTVAYSYLGPEITHAIYKNGTIGAAKAHLKKTANVITQSLQDLKGVATIAVNKAVVTQASAAIPVVPLYIALLFKLMKANHTHENCIQQMYRLFRDHLYHENPPLTDSEGYVRIDDLEMRADIQIKISQLWPTLSNANIRELLDLEGYRRDFYRLFGFDFEQVDYQAEVDPYVSIPELIEIPTN